MLRLPDASVLIASLDADEPHHAACDRLVAQGGHVLLNHALAETCLILTGGRLDRRLAPAQAAQLIEDNILPDVRAVVITGQELMRALKDGQSRRVRGGAVDDWLHLAAARKARVDSLVTLNLRDFQALARPGDPVISRP